ncbi:MAG TPA: hypothetical protein VGV35_04160 [Bryobacteraceae bacterium]|nr:hypothetical protein [Bryobacteraceae bacterium]
MRTISFCPLAAAFLFLMAAVGSAAAAPATQPVLLWPDGAPGATGSTDEDKPAITAYLPDPNKNTGAAILDWGIPTTQPFVLKEELWG